MARGTFTSDKVLYGDPKYIPALGERICMAFSGEGYEVKMESLLNGAVDISLTKGGLFKTILGLKTALKINMVPRDGNIYIKAGIGIFGQQAIPTVIAFLFWWPVLLMQIWGMVQQSKLDDKAIDIAEEELHKLMTEGKERIEPEKYDGPRVSAEEGGGRYCPGCGGKMSSDDKFCSECGAKL